MKRIISFVVVMLVVAGVIGATTPLFKDVRLGLDLKGGFEILYQATPTTQGEQVTRESLLQTAKSLEQRANALGTSEPEITTEGTDRIRLKIAGVTDEATVRQTMKEPAELTFRSADGCTTDTSAKKDEATSKKATESKKSEATSKSTSKDSNEVSAQSAGATQEINVDPTTGEATTAPGDTYNGAAEQDPATQDQDPLKVYCKVELTGNDFTENGASISYTQLNEPQIAIKLKDASKFAEITKRLTGKNLAIFLNDQLLSAPRVQGELSDGTAVITGTYTQEEAQQLKDQINLGALPLKLTEVYSQSVGATLGQQSLKDTLLAGVIGSILILLFMALIYRVPGLIAGFCIIVHTWLLVMIFIAGDFTLTLPGIAAFILGVGMGVDANIITYERIKDELRSGKSLLSAFKAGGRNSFSTIMDANVTTIIAGAVMFALGTGAVKGFALVLILNIIVSILTNVFFSRFLLSLLLKGKIITKAKSFGVKESERSAL